MSALYDGDYPNLSAAAHGTAEQPPCATFEFGLDLLIDALRTRYATPGRDELDEAGPSRSSPG